MITAYQRKARQNKTETPSWLRPERKAPRQNTSVNVRIHYLDGRDERMRAPVYSTARGVRMVAPGCTIQRKNACSGGAIQFCRRRPQRVDTMYGAIHEGRQGPHTIPFAMIHAFSENCSVEDMRKCVSTPSKFRKAMDEEEIFDYDTELKKFTKIHRAFQSTANKGKEHGEAVHTDRWGEQGWRELGERLINLNPYATYHWRTGIDRQSEEGHEMLAAKGTERAALNEYRTNQFISADTAISMIDGYEYSEFMNMDNFKSYIESIAQNMVDPKERTDFRRKLNEKFQGLSGV